jgi:hypothetical protein
MNGFPSLDVTPVLQSHDKSFCYCAKPFRSLDLCGLHGTPAPDNDRSEQ